MNPGEFVGRYLGSRRVEGIHTCGGGFIGPAHPDFPAAVAALQALIQPKPPVPLAGVHPGVGLRWCDGSIDAVIYHFWIDADGMHWEEAGRVYERRRG